MFVEVVNGIVSDHCRQKEYWNNKFQCVERHVPVIDIPVESRFIQVQDARGPRASGRLGQLLH